jgi:hypothetical protein
MFLSGEMMYVSALGQGVLVINSQRVAVDLLEKRSNIYSDRPTLHIRRRIRNEEPATLHDAIWRPVCHFDTLTSHDC